LHGWSVIVDALRDRASRARGVTELDLVAVGLIGDEMGDLRRRAEQRLDATRPIAIPRADTLALAKVILPGHDGEALDMTLGDGDVAPQPP
jgi:hypothetical protein